MAVRLKTKNWQAVNSCSSQTPLCEEAQLDDRLWCVLQNMQLPSQDLQLDFCVKWPSPKATTWLHDDRFLQAQTDT